MVVLYKELNTTNKNRQGTVISNTTRIMIKKSLYLIWEEIIVKMKPGALLKHVISKLLSFVLVFNIGIQLYFWEFLNFKKKIVFLFYFLKVNFKNKKYFLTKRN